MTLSDLQFIATFMWIPVLGVTTWCALQIMDLRVTLHKDFATKDEITNTAKVANAIYDLTTTLRDIAQHDLSLRAVSRANGGRD